MNTISGIHFRWLHAQLGNVVYAGIVNVIIPKLNEKDLTELPEEVKQKLKFTAAETVDEVLAMALERQPANH